METCATCRYRNTPPYLPPCVNCNATVDGLPSWAPDIPPPLGLTPAEVWKDMRIHDIIYALERYANAHYVIPTAWVRELEELLGFRNDCEASE